MPTKLPGFVTFTGADERTDVGRMLDIQARWDVEWGILFSPKLQGEGRYPPFDYVEGLAGKGLRLAAHVCGAYARGIVEGGRSPVLEILPPGTFGRVQVNTRDPGDPGALAAFAGTVGASRVILQAEAEFPADARVDWLSDRSRGTGAAPSGWPSAGRPHAMVGYAGGLGPDTVGKALPAIAEAAAGMPYWLDMETRVRTDDWFDLDACERVLRAVYGEGRA